MINFEDTQTAFQYKSKQGLRRAYFLFQAIKYPTLVKAGSSMLNLARTTGIPYKWAVKPTIYKHFVGGETIDKCYNTVRLLEKYNVRAILDYSVEGKENDADMEKALEETLQTVYNAAEDPNVPFAVFKPTAFAKSAVLEKASAGEELTAEEQEDADKFRRRVDTLCKAGYEKGIPVMIDAEDSWYQGFIDQVVTEMMERYNREQTMVFNTLQMYRNDRLDFLREALKKAEEGGYYLGMKYVRGAYMEKERERAAQMGYPSPIYPDKEATDQAYDEALKISMEHLDRISIFNGTHNERSSVYLTGLMEEMGVARDDSRIWFSQLYGMSDHISFNLAAKGYNVAKYVPFGPVKHVMPYLIRRAEENTSVKGQTSRELDLLAREMKRRKNQRD